MLTDSELTAMRSTASEALPGTAIIQRSTFTSDSGGGATYTQAAAGTVDCRLAPLSGSERDLADRISTEADYILTLPALTDVVTSDKVTVAGTTYEVVAVRDRSYEVTRRVEVTKVDS